MQLIVSRWLESLTETIILPDTLPHPCVSHRSRHVIIFPCFLKTARTSALSQQLN